MAAVKDSREGGLGMEGVRGGFLERGWKVKDREMVKENETYYLIKKSCFALWGEDSF